MSKPEALKVLEKWGLLLLQDPKLPSLVGIIAGEPLRGSWWGHPKGAEIFRTARELDDHPDVTSTKLVSGKVTFVHRRLWPQLISIGRAREEWQMSKLVRDARDLLKRVDEEKRMRATGKAAKQLEAALLVASEEVHTDSGAHSIELMTWEVFARQAHLRLPRISAVQARSEIEEVIDAMNAEFQAKGELPWTAPRGPRRGRASRTGEKKPPRK